MPSLPLQTRVAVTGLGLVTPHAADVASSWQSFRDGARSVRRLSREELLSTAPEVAPLLHAGWGDWSGAPAALARTAAARSDLDPVIDLALRAAAEAVTQARLSLPACDAERIGCAFGTSKGGLRAVQQLSARTRATALPASQRPLPRDRDLWSAVPPSAPAHALADMFGWQGPCLAPVAACATGLVAINRGARLIQDGACDVVVAGSSDASLHLPVLASFRRLGVLADPRVPPAEACRPFDRARSGFVIGEGAGVLVLERWEHARARGVPILAEWLAGLELADPAGLTVLSPDPAPLTRLIHDVLARAGCSPQAVDAVSLHGTGTRMNDRYEAAGLREAFGPALDRLLGFGLKGGIGHLLGAAASVETVVAIEALRRQVIPPTVNCDALADDAAAPVSPVARPATIRTVLKLSLGFGGHLAAALLHAGDVDDPATKRRNSV